MSEGRFEPTPGIQVKQIFIPRFSKIGPKLGPKSIKIECSLKFELFKTLFLFLFTLTFCRILDIFSKNILPCVLKQRLGFVADSVIQVIGRPDFEDDSSLEAVRMSSASAQAFWSALGGVW